MPRGLIFSCDCPRARCSVVGPDARQPVERAGQGSSFPEVTTWLLIFWGASSANARYLRVQEVGYSLAGNTDIGLWSHKRVAAHMGRRRACPIIPTRGEPIAPE